MPERKPKKKSRWGWWLFFILLGCAGAVFLVLRLARVDTKPGSTLVSAVASMRVICSANVNFQYAHPKQGYARSLKELADAEYIDKLLGSGEKRGYRFQYVAGKPGPNGIDEYHITARPMRYGSGWMGDGITSLYSDDGCVIRYTREDRAATAHDQALQ